MGSWDMSFKGRSGMFTFNLVNNGKTIKTFAKERDDLSCFTERLIWVHTVNGLGTGILVTQW